MGDALAIVSKSTFRESDWQDGFAFRPGVTVKWNDYESNLDRLDDLLQEGDRLFLVTVRAEPNQALWLMGVYEDVVRKPKGWYARRPNRIPITDITRLVPQLRFHNNKGLKVVPSKWGNALQSPRRLAPRDAELIAAEVARKSKVRLAKPAPQAPADPFDRAEGKRMAVEVQRYSRDPQLARGCLERDGFACVHCKFTTRNSYELRNLPAALTAVLHSHHINPLKDTKEVRTRPDDLIALCPTCHAVVHAIANALGIRSGLDAKLLRKHYTPQRHRRSAS